MDIFIRVTQQENKQSRIKALLYCFHSCHNVYSLSSISFAIYILLLYLSFVIGMQSVWGWVSLFGPEPPLR